MAPKNVTMFGCWQIRAVSISRWNSSLVFGEVIKECKHLAATFVPRNSVLWTVAHAPRPISSPITISS